MNSMPSPARTHSRSAGASSRKLHRGHFAFMRSVLQGLDVTDSWERYLRIEGEKTDARRFKSTIAWIRNEFAAAALREHKPGTARLVFLDASAMSQGESQPTLEAFAEAIGMEEFSTDDQIAAYEERYGKLNQRGSRRARLIERQLVALQWLEGLVAQEPRAGDAVSAWFAPELAKPLAAADMPTLFTVAQRINGVGFRWWSTARGIGETKGGRIVEWMRAHQVSTGLAIGAHSLARRRELTAAQLQAVVPPSTALVPFERFRVPQDLDGSAGQFRGTRHHCLLSAVNDYEAIDAWLKSKRASPQTERTYRREAERLLLWSILERRKPISSLTVEDATAFMDFLAAPPARWCGPRHRQRWSPLWRPIEGPLHPPARHQALKVLSILYGFLVQQGYVVGNPFGGVRPPDRLERPLGSNRALTRAQWEAVEKTAAADPSPVGRRRARAVRWLYATGLRPAEMAAARCVDLEHLEYRKLDGSWATGWLLNVIGKGQRRRRVPVPASYVAELQTELALQGREPNVSAPANADFPILAGVSAAGPQPWSAPGLYKAVGTLFKRTAEQLQGRDAERLQRASSHWLRHSHGSHALAGGAGRVPVPLEVVRNNLGHASIGTTSGYLTTELDARLQAMDGFWTDNE